MNKEKDQDRVHDTIDHFERFGYVMFPSQLKIYRFLIEKVIGHSILEAGCGMGLGTNILHAEPHTFIMGTDKLKKNVDFAKALYPQIEFSTWDITKGPWQDKYEMVVCVECVEHVADVKGAIQNLIASAKKEVWFTTPNRSVETPDNPYHVREYSAKEMLEIIGDYKVEFYDWRTEKQTGPDSDCDPLIYRIIL